MGSGLPWVQDCYGFRTAGPSTWCKCACELSKRVFRLFRRPARQHARLFCFFCGSFPGSYEHTPCSAQSLQESLSRLRKSTRKTLDPGDPHHKGPLKPESLCVGSMDQGFWGRIAHTKLHPGNIRQRHVSHGVYSWHHPMKFGHTLPTCFSSSAPAGSRAA